MASERKDEPLMSRWFNIAGPCFADEHYLIPPERRAGEAKALVAQGRWFSLVAGRQTGKTTLLRALEARLNVEGAHPALWIDLEEVRTLAEPTAAFRTLLSLVGEALARVRPGSPPWTPTEVRTAWCSRACAPCATTCSETRPGLPRGWARRHPSTSRWRTSA